MDVPTQSSTEKMIKTEGKVSTVVSPGIAEQRKNWELAVPAGPDLYREHDERGMKLTMKEWESMKREASQRN